MTIGTTRLSDGSLVRGFCCESYALSGAREISQFGGWRAFRASR
jgi:allophanate hydrolase